MTSSLCHRIEANIGSLHWSNIVACGLADQCWVHKQKVLVWAPVVFLSKVLYHNYSSGPRCINNTGKVTGSLRRRGSDPHTTGNWVWSTSHSFFWHSFREGDGRPDLYSQVEDLPLSLPTDPTFRLNFPQTFSYKILRNYLNLKSHGISYRLNKYRPLVQRFFCRTASMLHYIPL